MPLHQINLAKYLKPENYKLLLKKNLKNETELLYFEMQLIRCFENKLLNLFEKFNIMNASELYKLKNIYTINQFNHAGLNIGSIKTIV